MRSHNFYTIVLLNSLLAAICKSQILACPNNVLADGFCINGQCGNPSFYTCINNVCCRQNAGQQGTCRNGAPAAGPCLQGVCGSGYICEGALCCPQIGQSQCPAGQSQVGLNCAACPFGSRCINNVCCSATTTTGGQCPSTYVQTGGSCVTGCTSSGAICLNNVCCALRGGPPVTASCPSGYLLTGTNCAMGCAFGSQCVNNVCCQRNGGITGTCPAGSSPTSGNCINGCAFGSQCINNICCSSGTIGSQCPAGYVPTASRCGQCPIGTQCINNICCRNTVVVTPAPSLTCPTGYTLTGLCSLQQACPIGSQCYTGGACCRPPTTVTPQCPDRSNPVAICINGVCGGGFYCYGGYCCRHAVTSTNVCGPTGGVPVCPCTITLLCPVQASCQQTSNTCCSPTSSNYQTNRPYYPPMQTALPYYPPLQTVLPYYPPARPYYPPYTNAPYYPPVTQTPFYPTKAPPVSSTVQQVQQQITTYRPVLMYTIMGDPSSSSAKQILSTYSDVRGYYLDIDSSGQQAAVMQALQQLTQKHEVPFVFQKHEVPFVFVCGRYIGSTAELSALHAANALRTQARSCAVGRNMLMARNAMLNMNDAANVTGVVQGRMATMISVKRKDIHKKAGRPSALDLKIHVIRLAT